MEVLQGNLLVEHQPKSCTVRLFVSSDPEGIYMRAIDVVYTQYMHSMLVCVACNIDIIYASSIQAMVQMSSYIEQYVYYRHSGYSLA